MSFHLPLIRAQPGVLRQTMNDQPMNDQPRVTQGFLDSSQYLESTILQYESIYGEDFVSPGGRKVASELIASMGLEAVSQVLDVGCGLGGSAFLMAREFRFIVDGS